MRSRFEHIILSIIIGLSIFPEALAQYDYATHTADKYFENTYYQKAIPLYERYLKHHQQDHRAMLNLADAYYYTFELQKAYSWYVKLDRLHQDKLDKDVYFRMVQTLKALGKTDKADRITRSRLLKNSSAFEMYLSERQYLANVKAIGDRYEIDNLAINTERSAFGSSILADSLLVFAAAKKNAGILSRIFHWNAQPYLDLYSIPVDDLNTEPSVFSEEISTASHESSAVFTKDGKTVYFTRNMPKKDSQELNDKKIGHLQIHRAEFIDGQWTNITALPINGDSFSTEHPALSKDEDTLYFSSNRPGGYGEYDLYKVSIKDLREPINLGESINTSRREQFPFISEEDHLYFSSNGHPGFGFMDIFISKKKDGKFRDPDNIGLPVNSGYDDFAFYINANKAGFFSSNRPSGKGSDDIYKLKETKELIIEDCYQWVTGKTLHKKNGQLITNARVALYKGDKKLQVIKTGDDAAYKFKVECGQYYFLKASKQGYQGDRKSFMTSINRKKKNQVDLFLISDKELKQIEQEQAKRSAEEQKARIRVQARRKRDKEQKVQQAILEKEPLLEQKGKDIFIKTENIYFDYDLWYIRKESREVLDSVVDLLKRYPEMKIEIGTHTDIRGDKEYNKKLSQKRSKAVLEYFGSQGIDTSRITPKGYGEEKPIIHCETEDSCTEAQHEINRRCEFKVLSFTK